MLDILKQIAFNVPWYFWLAIIIAVGLRLQFGKFSHIEKIWRARLQLFRFRRISSAEKQFYFLRSVDPFVFEEMILTALKDLGHKIKRNKRYTGDGGIDGRAEIHSMPVFIQAKRYKAHINHVHVAEFRNKCSRNRVKGIFIHTGKTGKQSWNKG